jgi:hypothetical protein
MILLPELIKKLQEMQEYYPEIPVDIDKIVIHVSIHETEHPAYISFTKTEG